MLFFLHLKRKTLTTPGTVFVTGWRTTTDKYVLFLSVMNIKVSVVLNLNPHLDCSVTSFQYATHRYHSHFLSALNGLIMAKKSLQNISCNYDISDVTSGDLGFYSKHIFLFWS